MSYHHGVTLIHVAQGPRSIRDAKSSVIGMVCTADDADAAVFPLNTPVLVDSVDYLTSAGTTGTTAASTRPFAPILPEADPQRRAVKA